MRNTFRKHVAFYREGNLTQRRENSLMDSLEDRGGRGDTLFIGETVSEQTVQRKVLCADEEVKHQWAEITVLPPAGQLGYNCIECIHVSRCTTVRNKSIIIIIIIINNTKPHKK